MLAGLLALAFALRIHRLDAHQLWWDEGSTITFGQLPLAEHIALAVETDEVKPPYYRWAVALVMEAVGPTAFAARIVGVWSGVLLTAFGGMLGRKLSGPRVGVISAALLAFAPFQIYYAQEAKSYIVVGLLAMPGVWLWLRLHKPLCAAGERAPVYHWLGYGVLVGLLVGSHYIAILAVGTANLATAWLTWRATRRGATWRMIAGHWARYLGTQALGAAMLLPFVIATFDSTTTGFGDNQLGRVARGPVGYLTDVLGDFAAGVTAPTAALTLILTGLAGVGLMARHRRGGRAVLLVWLAGPVALGFLYQLCFPRFPSRFIIYSQPALLILAAAGLVHITRRAPWLAGAGILLAGLLAIPALHAIYARPANPAEDWRPLAADMQPWVQSDDLFIYGRHWMPGYLHVYLPPAPEPDYYLGFFHADRLDAEMTALIEDKQRIWVVSYQAGFGDPRNQAGEWLRSRYPAALAAWYGNTHLALFVTSGDAPCRGVTKTQFDNMISLEGCAPETATTGSVLYVPLRWTCAEAQDAAWVVFVHLVNERGEPVAQHDGEPCNGTCPTWAWASNAEIEDAHALLIPPDLPPGLYALRVGLYDRDTGTRLLTVDGEDGVVLGNVRVH